MSGATRPIPTHLRHASLSGAGSTSSASGASPLLAARIAEKKAELENLRELRDLSGQLADQMQMLEDKLATLSGGTEAVAAVLGNWGAVLKAINMASMKIPKPKDEQGDLAESGGDREGRVPLPETLVRIPVQDGSGGQSAV